MKLLFDQNVSYRIVKKILLPFPFSEHISNLNLYNKDDIEIWNFAYKNNYTIVTFDSDFYDISLIHGCPPKIIWLKSGNIATDEISQKLIKNKDIIKKFIQEKEFSEITCLELY